MKSWASSSPRSGGRARGNTPHTEVQSCCLFYLLVSCKSKGEHDHPKPETKLEAEARRTMKKAHAASASVPLKLKESPETKVTCPPCVQNMWRFPTPVVRTIPFSSPSPLTNEVETIPSDSSIGQHPPEKRNRIWGFPL